MSHIGKAEIGGILMTEGLLRPNARKSIEEVLDQLERSWVPVNQQHANFVLKRIEAGEYNDPALSDALLNDLKGDISLYLLCIRELSREINEAPDNPADLIRDAEKDRVKELIEFALSEGSFHSFDRVRDFQAEALRTSMVAASASEELAEASGINGDLGFSCSLLRRLGLTLIAWNYPSVYAKACLAGNLSDAYLSRELGFAPTLLAVALTRRWGISPVVRRVVGDKSAPLTETTQRIGEALEHFCKLGDVLAGKENLSLRQFKEEQWKAAESSISEILGIDGLHKLLEKVELSVQRYAESMPELFPKSLSFGEEGAKRRAPLADALEANPYLAACAEPLRSKLKSLYGRIKPGCVSKECVDVFFNDILPLAGVKAGTLYLAETDSKNLTPKRHFGTLSFPAKTLSYESANSSSHPIIRSYSRGELVWEWRRIDEEILSIAAVPLTASVGWGVLYLELDDSGDALLSDDDENRLKAKLKALGQAAKDCMDLY